MDIDLSSKNEKKTRKHRIECFLREGIYYAAFLVLTVTLTPFLAAANSQTSLTSIPETSPQTISGYLLEKGTKRPMASASVFLLPAKMKAQTNAMGYFEFSGVPPGKVTWVVNISGYHRLEKLDEIQKDQSKTQRKLYLEKLSYDYFETTIYGQEVKRDETTRTLTRREFLHVPGARGDPIKAVENLPGVARANAFSSQVIIQGSAPQDTRYSIDGHEVPLIFHFGGLTSVLTPESIDSVDYLAAGYGPEFGRALGGQVAVRTRSPKNDRLQGFAFIDTFNAGAMVETRLSQKSSLLLGARQSYIGSVLKSVLPNSSDFNLTVAPEYRDAVAIYETELTHRDQFKLVGVASQDTLQFLFTQPNRTDPSLRGTFNNETAFFRLIPQITHRHSDRTTSRLSFGVGKDWIRVDLGSNFFSLQSTSLTSRYELEKKLFPSWTVYSGMDHIFTWSHVNLDLPTFYSVGGVANPISTATQRRATINPAYQTLGFYLRNKIHDPESPWTFMPNLRLEHYSSTGEFPILPRAAVRYHFSESLHLHGEGGLYSQSPQPQEVDGATGNPDIKSNRAVHLAMGVENDFKNGSRNGFILSSGPFYKYLYQLVAPSSALVTRNGYLVPENYNNGRKGEVYGLQTQVKYQLSALSGWLSYTLSRSTRTDGNGNTFPFQYDQTHILALLGSYDLSKNWKISTRFRFTSGNPFTPVIGGVFDADNDVYIPLRGDFYSQRMEPFYQLDVRIDKKWIFQQWILSIYLDIQNVTNTKNIQQVQYSYDYATSAYITGLPITPTFGIKGEF